jgi:GTP cyclohydrolase I
MPDTQSARDERHVAIQRVGVRGVHYPIVVEVDGRRQTPVANWTLDVALPADQKGTHMSRFVALLNEWDDAGEPLTAVALRAGIGTMLDRLQAESGRMEAAFRFFRRKVAPVSGVSSLLDYQGRWMAERRDGVDTIWCEVAVPVKSLCPCSKEISDYGAHNQRSIVTICAEVLGDVSFEPLVRCAEASASSEIWPLLKRTDEKWITERAYDNPKFVEDLVRDVALGLQRLPGVGRFHVDVENFESIHNHSAFACIDGRGPGAD